MQDDQNNLAWNFEKAPTKSEVSAESLARAEEFENAMEDAPAFAGESEENSFADATAIISYGANDAARIYGVEHVVDTINKFNPNTSEDPINDLLKELGLNRKEDRDDARETLSDEQAFLNANSNPSASKNISRENAMHAIKDFQEMIRTVKADSDRFGGLNSDAIDSGKGVFEQAAEQEAKTAGKNEDLISMFKGLEAQKHDDTNGQEAPEHSEEKPAGSDQPVSLEELQNMAKSADEAKEEEENKAA